MSNRTIHATDEQLEGLVSHLKSLQAEGRHLFEWELRSYAYLTETLEEGHAFLERVDRHLQTCEHCARELEEHYLVSGEPTEEAFLHQAVAEAERISIAGRRDQNQLSLAELCEALDKARETCGTHVFWFPGPEVCGPERPEVLDAPVTNREYGSLYQAMHAGSPAYEQVKEWLDGRRKRAGMSNWYEALSELVEGRRNDSWSTRTEEMPELLREQNLVLSFLRCRPDAGRHLHARWMELIQQMEPEEFDRCVNGLHRSLREVVRTEVTPRVGDRVLLSVNGPPRAVIVLVRWIDERYTVLHHPEVRVTEGADPHADTVIELVRGELELTTQRSYFDRSQLPGEAPYLLTIECSESLAEAEVGLTDLTRRTYRQTIRGIRPPEEMDLGWTPGGGGSGRGRSGSGARVN